MQAATAPLQAGTTPDKRDDPCPHLAQYRYNSETARAAGVKAAAARWKRHQDRQQTLAVLPDAAARCRAEQLQRVREQLARVDRMLRKETDAKALLALSETQGRLWSQERQLAGCEAPRRPAAAPGAAGSARSVSDD